MPTTTCTTCCGMAVPGRRTTSCRPIPARSRTSRSCSSTTRTACWSNRTRHRSTRCRRRRTPRSIPPLVFSTANGNLISVADTDDASVEVTLSADQRHPDAERYDRARASPLGDGSDDTDMTFSGTLADINAALDGLQFDPTAAFEGFASVQIATTDFGGGGAGSPADRCRRESRSRSATSTPRRSIPFRVRRPSSRTACCCSRLPPAPRSRSATSMPVAQPSRSR